MLNVPSNDCLTKCHLFPFCEKINNALKKCFSLYLFIYFLLIIIIIVIVILNVRLIDVA